MVGDKLDSILLCVAGASADGACLLRIMKTHMDTHDQSCCLIHEGHHVHPCLVDLEHVAPCECPSSQSLIGFVLEAVILELDGVDLCHKGEDLVSFKLAKVPKVMWMDDNFVEPCVVGVMAQT